MPNRAKGLALLFWDGYNGRYFLGLLEPGEEEIREAVLKLFSDWDLGEHARFEQELHAYTLSQEEMEEVWEELRWSAQKKAPSKATGLEAFLAQEGRLRPAKTEEA